MDGGEIQEMLIGSQVQSAGEYYDSLGHGSSFMRAIIMYRHFNSWNRVVKDNLSFSLAAFYTIGGILQYKDDASGDYGILPAWEQDGSCSAKVDVGNYLGTIYSLKYSKARLNGL